MHTLSRRNEVCEEHGSNGAAYRQMVHMGHGREERGEPVVLGWHGPGIGPVQANGASADSQHRPADAQVPEADDYSREILVMTTRSPLD